MMDDARVQPRCVETKADLFVPALAAARTRRARAML